MTEPTNPLFEKGFPTPNIDLSNMGEREIEALGSIMDEVGAPLYMVTIGTHGATARPTPYLSSMIQQAANDDEREVIQDHIMSAVDKVLRSLLEGPEECDCEHHRHGKDEGHDADR